MAAGLLITVGLFFIYLFFPSLKVEEQALMSTHRVFVSSRLTASDIFVDTVLLISGYLLTQANSACLLTLYVLFSFYLFHESLFLLGVHWHCPFICDGGEK